MIPIFDPLQVMQAMWPQSWFYSKQREMIYSVRDSYETYVAAGNELGKDFILGRICLTMMVSPWSFYGREHFLNIDRTAPPGAPEYVAHSRRIVTTSVKDKHLDVLWGEIGSAWRTCSFDLSQNFVMTHHEVRFKREAEEKNAMSYLIGVVSGSENLEGLTGHHARYTLACGDESSGLTNKVDEAFGGWAKRRVYIGNPLPCNNFFKKNFQAGDLVQSISNERSI